MKKPFLKSLFYPLSLLTFVLNSTIAIPHAHSEENHDNHSHSQKYTVVKTDKEWKQQLTPQQYNILRQKGTERAFTGKYNKFYKKGVYRCAACGQILFDSNTKFDSGTGWPSFWAPFKENNIELKDDSSFFMKRTEVLCSRCGGHLGHVFDDGPKPTELRYCINSAALEFDETVNQSKEITPTTE